MNDCRNNYGCLDCDSGCDHKCGPAAYQCDFNIAADPLDGSFWNVTWCGKLHRVKLPAVKETDTKHSLNVSNATLNYQGESHNETWTGAQLGSIITIGDLRDARVDYDTSAMCYELIYHKYGDCGEGCKSLDNAWSTFSIDNENALGNQIRYVRGANRYGCPQFLNTPTPSSGFWFQGWRGDTMENGYFQPSSVATLPTNSTTGDPYVMSQNQTTKAPVIGTLPWNCVLQNIFGNLGVDISGVWTEVEGTPGFGASFNQMTGDFQIRWSDWNNIANHHKAGDGVLTGKISWDITFDVKTGTIQYVVHHIYFDTVTWTPDEGVTRFPAPTLYLWAVAIPGGTETDLIPGGITFGSTRVERQLGQTFSINQTYQVGPGQTVGPFNFVRIHVDWDVDDRGYMGVQFASKLTGWTPCS